MRGKFALSEWALERRLIGPWSERVDHLKATVSFARQLAWLIDAKRDEAERLASVGRAFVGAPVEPTSVRAQEIQRAAEAELEHLVADDWEWREDAAARGRQLLSEEEQLWGAAPPALVRDSVG
jgi:hypothetical protein